MENFNLILTGIIILIAIYSVVRFARKEKTCTLKGHPTKFSRSEMKKIVKGIEKTDSPDEVKEHFRNALKNK